VFYTLKGCGSWLGASWSLVDLDMCSEVWLASLEEALPIMGAKMGLTAGVVNLDLSICESLKSEGGDALMAEK